MKRFKSIDIFRGLGMVYIMVGHMIDWWSQPADDWLFYIHVSLFSALGAAGFVFVSGISTMISYRVRLVKVKGSREEKLKHIRLEYYIRAILILGLALLYNGIVAIQFFDPAIIWKWFIILTVAGCLFLAWPLLKASKILRIAVAILIWIINQIILAILLPFQNQFNLPGLFFYILYNSLDQNPILSFFTFFLVGTVVGEIIFEFSLIDNKSPKKIIFFKKKIFKPLLISGILLIAIGILFLYPELFTERILTINTNIWWMIYTLGIDLIIISILLSFEIFGKFNTQKSYKFLFYFSYYSLSLFILQNINFFIFYNSLDRYNIWGFIIASVVLYGLLLRFLYFKLEGKFSLKVQIGRLTVSIARKFKNHLLITQ
ncbi:MAG: acyltransferase family protein [Promethearchaeota archaeon]